MYSKSCLSTNTITKGRYKKKKKLCTTFVSTKETLDASNMSTRIY